MNTAPFHIAYGTAKAAMVAMTRTMAVELALDNIRVNAVAPGVTETAASRTYVDEDPDRDPQAIAMGRRGRPEEQAGAILFFLSDLSSYITGQTLLVDGGLNLKWTHLGADNTSLFLKDESFRAPSSVRRRKRMTDLEAKADVGEELSEPMTIGVEAYISEDYARAERDKLWRKVWQQVGRVEEIPEVGGYLTYDILDDSIIVVRTGPNEFTAHHNVCMHRGRRLVDTPDGAKNACGKARKSFVCGFHGWTYGLDGACTHIREQDDWKGALTPQNTHLAPVQVDTWGGWLFINMDPDWEPLADYLFPAAKMLDPFGLENMRFKWRKWLNFDCNWKVAMEAFNETYHVFTTHPEFNKFGEFKGWAKAQGRHSNIGYDAPKGMDETKSKIRLGTGDPRISTAEMQVYTMEETNATTTQTLVNAAKRLVDELPEGTPADEVLQHWLTSARRDDEARGVVWPTIPADILGQSGTAWQIFPNFQIGQGLTSALCYSARPDPSYDPNKCIFEVAVYELYPKGEEPQTEWDYTPSASPNWLSVLPQDFSNMAAVQQGMKSLGFPGTKPNPYRERSTVNLHYQLAKYMGTGEPQEL